MQRLLRVIAGLTIVMAVSLGTARAADSDIETRLREALRAATAQVRTLEDERAALQAKQTETEKQKEMLREQVEALTAQLAHAPAESSKRDERASARQGDYEQAVAEFNRRLSAQNEAMGKLGDSMEKWKTAYNDAANVARAKEAERAKLAEEMGGLSQRATRCEAQNVELFNIGNELLGRYAAMDVGDALSAREPFIGLKRVELENLVQDYRDKLLDQKATP